MQAKIRTIFHLDMDAFYASIEQRDDAAFKDKPIIVGADPKSGQGRGVVAACSYQAREFGIHSAMPISRAFRLCPEGIYLPPDFPKYQRVSQEIRGILRSFTQRIEPVSIDEAFLDMSERVRDEENAITMARSVKSRIFDEQRLVSSVGIAPNKFVAKIASDMDKPDGLVLVSSGEVQLFLDPLPISRLWGVGPKTEERLSEMEINTILQLRHFDKYRLIKRLGKMGEHLWKLSNGIDDRTVVGSRAPKSIGHERTFSEDVRDERLLEETLNELSGKIAKRLSCRDYTGRTIILKLRYSDFTTITRQITLSQPVRSAPEICNISQQLLQRFLDSSRWVRLIGVSLSSLRLSQDTDRLQQMRLF